MSSATCNGQCTTDLLLTPPMIASGFERRIRKNWLKAEPREPFDSPPGFASKMNEKAGTRGPNPFLVHEDLAI